LAAVNIGLGATESAQPAAIQQLASNVTNTQVNEFATYADLVNWLKQDDTHEQVYSATFQCVDFAMMLSEHAYKQGFGYSPPLT